MQYKSISKFLNKISRLEEMLGITWPNIFILHMKKVRPDPKWSRDLVMTEVDWILHLLTGIAVLPYSITQCNHYVNEKESILLWESISF